MGIAAERRRADALFEEVKRRFGKYAQVRDAHPHLGRLAQNAALGPVNAPVIAEQPLEKGVKPTRQSRVIRALDEHALRRDVQRKIIPLAADGRALADDEDAFRAVADDFPLNAGAVRADQLHDDRLRRRARQTDGLRSVDDIIIHESVSFGRFSPLLRGGSGLL